MLENVDKTTPRFLIINYLFSELQKRVTNATLLLFKLRWKCFEDGNNLPFGIWRHGRLNGESVSVGKFGGNIIFDIYWN